MGIVEIEGYAVGSRQRLYGSLRLLLGRGPRLMPCAVKFEVPISASSCPAFVVVDMERFGGSSGVMEFYIYSWPPAAD